MIFLTIIVIVIAINLLLAFNNEKENEKTNMQNNTKDASDSKKSDYNLLNLFIIPNNISREIESYLKKYDKYIESVNDYKDEFLLDLTSYIIISNEVYSNY